MQKKFNLVAVLLLLQILVGVSPVFAHSKDKHKKADSSQVGLSDTMKSPPAMGQPAVQHEHPYLLRPLDAILEHVHNKIVHLPIGFGLAAFLLSLISLRLKEAQIGIRWLVLLAAVSSVAVVVTGLNQASVFEEQSKQWVVEVHENLGIVTAALLWVWTLFSFRRSLQRFAWIVGILVLCAILVTGYFGGVLAHG